MAERTRSGLDHASPGPVLQQVVPVRLAEGSAPSVEGTAPPVQGLAPVLGLVQVAEHKRSGLHHAWVQYLSLVEAAVAVTLALLQH